MAHSNHRQHYFAPGAIEHHVYSRAHQKRALVRWVKRIGLFMAAVVWLLLVFTAVASTAHAQTTAHPLTPTTVGLHIASHHLDESTLHDQTWNNQNPGVYAKWGNGLTVGALRNSNRRTSVYAGWTGETPEWHGISAAITLGLTTGYRQPFMVAPSVAVAVTEHARARITWLPKAHAQASNALHLSAEWRF